SDPAQLPYVLENAIRAAVGRRGVAVIVIPGDIALRSAPKRGISPNAGLLPAPPIVRPAEPELEALARLLNGAKRVTLFCGRGCKLDLGLVGDVGAALGALLPKLKAKTERKHLDDSLAHYRKARAGLDELAQGTPGQKPIHPQYLARLLSERASEDAVFTADV